MANAHGRYRLHWTRSTPFTAVGTRGIWSIRWDQLRKRYTVSLDAVEQPDIQPNTVVEAKRWVEQKELGRVVCPQCDGSGFTKAG